MGPPVGFLMLPSMGGYIHIYILCMDLWGMKLIIIVIISINIVRTKQNNLLKKTQKKKFF